MAFLDLALAPASPPWPGDCSCRQALGLSTSGTETQADAFFPAPTPEGLPEREGGQNPHPTPTAFSESSPALPVPPS